MPSERSTGGRPRARINLDDVEMLAGRGATDGEIALHFHISRQTITRAKRTRAYREAVKRGRRSASYHAGQFAIA